MGHALIRSGLIAVLALGTVGAAAADVIHLTNGSELRVEAWRDVGDAVEVAVGGGLMRISKSDIRKIDGKARRGDLYLRSNPTTAAVSTPAEGQGAGASGSGAGAPPDSGVSPEVAAMQDLVAEGQALFGQGALTSAEKAAGFRRLAERLQSVSPPDRLRGSHARAGQAFQAAIAAYQAESQNPGDPTTRLSSRLEAARGELGQVQQEIKTKPPG
jgi:hypothetical protein